MAHSRKQQGQYRKIIKDDNPDSLDLSVPSVPSVFLSSSIFSITIPSSTLSFTSSVIPMPKDQFKQFINKLCDNMYDNLYGQLYNNIKSDILGSLSEKQSIKNNKTTQQNTWIEDPIDIDDKNENKNEDDE